MVTREVAAERLQQFFRCDGEDVRVDVPEGWSCEAGGTCAQPLTICVQPDGRFWSDLRPRSTNVLTGFTLVTRPECVTTSPPEPDYVWQFLTDWD